MSIPLFHQVRGIIPFKIPKILESDKVFGTELKRKVGRSPCTILFTNDPTRRTRTKFSKFFYIFSKFVVVVSFVCSFTVDSEKLIHSEAERASLPNAF